MNILELYCGIGGMHCALNRSKIDGKVIAAVDINPVAISVYKYNFPEINLLNRNIQSLTSRFVNSLGVNTILMSPPCQPFTRNGLQADILDERTKSFVHILGILAELTIENILIENVKGFENSQMRDLLIRTLEACNFVYQEFILNPTQLGVPNSRLRYYCLAKKQPSKFNFETGGLMTELPFMKKFENSLFKISDILTKSPNDVVPYLLENKILKKYLNILDICTSSSENSCCFTKAYGRFLEGTGSVFSPQTKDFMDDVFKQLDKINLESEEYLKLAQSLELRYFTAEEICKLMCFPDNFSFPLELKNRQKYMLLGNSINVKVVAELIKLL